MSSAAQGTDDGRVARELLALWRTGRRRGAFGLADMAAAGRVTARLRELREARGERVSGRKIGFTNTSIWPLYGVAGPMWNYVWDTTVQDAAGPEAEFDLTGLPEPRIEPEIAFRLGRTPDPEMDETALFGCVEAVTHSLEIVQCVFPGWKLTGPDSAAAFGLHGGLILGPWRAVADDPEDWRARIAGASVSLRHEGAQVETGRATAVLGGPLTALRFLVRTLAEDPRAEPLGAGEIVTTGTMTDAHPVAPGETWETAISGVDLAGLRVRFTGTGVA